AVGVLLESEWQRPFDLRRGPLIGSLFVRLSGDRHLLILTFAGLAADRRTLDNVAAEIASFYEAGPVGAGEAAEEDVLQYLQYSEWHHELVAAEGEQGRKHWHQVVPPGSERRLALPEEQSAPHLPFSPRLVLAGVDGGTGRAAAELAAALGAAAGDVVLAAWEAFLARLGERSDFLVGCACDGRRLAELRDGLGPMAVIVPVVAGLSPELTFAAAVARVQAERREAEEWQEVFFATHVAGEEDLGPVADATFEDVERLGPRTALGVTFSCHAQRVYLDLFALGLVCVRSPAGLRLELHYDSSRYAPAAGDRLARRFGALLADGLARPGAAIGELAILDESERRWLVEDLNASAAETPHASCLHQLFESQAERTPDAAAVACDGRAASFAELNTSANRLARHLRGQGVGPESKVALFFERSPELVVGMLAALKAGGAYLPLDVGNPAERLAFVLADAAPRVILTTRELAARLPPSSAALVLVDADRVEIARLPGGDLAADVRPDNLAYVLYTSGSSGTPKGVMVHHRGLVNYLAWAVRYYDIAAGRGAPVDSPMSFDLTVTALWGPLLAGRTVTLLRDSFGRESPETAAGVQPFSLLKITPAHLELARHDLERSAGEIPALALVVGGEALEGEKLAFWRRRAPAIRVINEYGPTETVVGCAVYEVPPGTPRGGPVPIGRPVANMRLYVLDRDFRVVPTGVAGELYIAGPGVARGYLGRPELTAERFLPDPFAGGAGERFYRSGDLARHLPSGDLLFLGRRDHQVKVRGFRIELGEIEAVLARCPAVLEAAVTVREDLPGDRRLVGYVVPRDGKMPAVEELRGWLLAKLPDYMVPAAFVPLDALPLTANGKLDRGALTAPDTRRPDLKGAYVAPRTPVEEILAMAWEGSLGIETVGIHDNFFVLGGDSMRSVRLVALAQERGLAFTVQELFRRPTISQLAEKLEADLGIGGEGGGGEALPARDEDIDRLAGLSEDDVLSLLKANV
ncbi:MAG TPA: amino acid adenylation domain-containing protein, partial [Thermoanaerobaculia bacterium]|nr:amino acid adenylation domain-containing protein [Thermoanaerobaculia bacterium]